MDTPHTQAEILARAGQMLAEYNESAGAIHRTLNATGRKLTSEDIEVAVSYREIIVRLGDDAPVFKEFRELRYNATAQSRVHRILSDLRRGEIDLAAALELLNHVERDSPPHSRWLAALLLGVAAASLAVLLGADFSAAMVVGFATGLGLVARQELARHHFNLLALPLAAAFIGAALGGFAIRLGWTTTPIVLIVPSLMLIPGPHLINALLDLIDNYLPMCIARLGLAVGIIIASALGIVLGIELTLSDPPFGEQIIKTGHLTLISDMLLAGVVTCGFAVYYNASWPTIGMAVVGGMAGHGIRFLALEAGCRLEVATFLGCLAVGLISALIARTYKVPVAVVAFAGAVTMMPGTQMYRTLGGFLQLARLGNSAELPTIAGTLGEASQACLVVGAIALGLIIAVRAVQVLTAEQQI
jgi:uncharacterized membrane protein YjjP (DUF1212 family)